MEYAAPSGGTSGCVDWTAGTRNLRLHYILVRQRLRGRDEAALQLANSNESERLTKLLSEMPPECRKSAFEAYWNLQITENPIVRRMLEERAIDLQLPWPNEVTRLMKKRVEAGTTPDDVSRAYR